MFRTLDAALDLLAEVRETAPLYDSKAHYMSRAFGNPESVIRDARLDLDGVEFDTMIGRGLSGTLVVPILARVLDKHWAIVRKEDGSHSDRRVEGRVGRRWLFVDDFVQSGATRDAVRAAIGDLDIDTEWVGTYQYETFSPRFVPAGH